MAQRRGKRGGGSRFGWILLAVVGLLLAVSLGLRYGERWGSRLAASRRSPDEGAPGVRSASGQDSSGLRALPADTLALLDLRIQILNATGLPDLALVIGENLRAWGVDALDRGNAPAWPFPETLVVLRSQRAPDVAAFAERLGGVPVIVQRREDLMLDATLILGHDWESYHWPRP